MKVLLFFFLIFSQFALGIYSLDGGLSYFDNEMKIQELKRKQECLERKQREQEDYANCVSMCQITPEIGCYCSAPTSYCY